MLTVLPVQTDLASFSLGTPWNLEPGNQSVIELQCLLWLYNLILDRQTLLKLLQAQSTLGSVTADAEAEAICRLRSLLSS